MNDYFAKNLDYDRIRGRQVFICGASLLSVAVIRNLQKSCIAVSGIVDPSFHESDHSMRFCGVSVYGMSDLNGVIRSEAVVLVCCNTKGQGRRCIAEIHAQHPGVECRMLWNPTEVYIDVSGNCGLRCRSCQVANHRPESFPYRNRGNMSLAMFERILDKIHEELPECPGVFLFNYGEPLLCPKLPEMIDILHKHGLVAVISSSLSVDYDFERLIASKPDVIKISLSGFTQRVYETTHNGGNVFLVKSNMYKLKALADRFGAETGFVVGYHIYNNNAGTELERVRSLCRELGFLFQPRRANFCNIPKLCGIDAFSETDRRFIQTYYPNADDILSVQRSVQPVPGTCRNALHRLFIDYDGHVFLCFMVMHSAGIFDSYLDTTLPRIREWQRTHWICQHCRQAGLASIEEE